MSDIDSSTIMDMGNDKAGQQTPIYSDDPFRGDTPMRNNARPSNSDVSVTDKTSNPTGDIDEDGFPPGRTIICMVEPVFIPSWFFVLPEHIRNRIYRFYLFPQGQDQAPCPYFSATTTWRVKPPALLQASPSLRRETLPIYYGALRIATRTARDLIPWLKTLDPKSREALSAVKVQWDYEDQKRQTEVKQINKMWAELKTAQVEFNRKAIAIS